MIAIVKDKGFIREVLLKALFLFIGFYFFRSLAQRGRFGIMALIFPDLNSLFSLYKFFFLSLTTLVVLEYLIMFELPPNFLLSRAAALTVMLMLATVLYAAHLYVFGGRMGLPFLLVLSAGCVFFGQVISYRLQRKQSLRFEYGLGFLNYFLVAGFLMGEVLLNL